MIKKLISLLLVIAVMLAFMPTALCADTVSLNALSNATAGDKVTISGTASLSEVSIKVVNPDKTILFLDTVVPSGGTFSTTLTLPEDMAAGTYTVTAGKGSTTATTNLSVTALPPIQLATPAKPSLSGGIATWKAVANENNGYSLKLYKGTTLSGTVKIAHGAALSYDLSTAMTAGGSYTLTVTALGAGRYVNSEASPESDPQVVTVKVTGVSLNAIGISLLVGNSQTLTAVVTPAGAENKAVTWTSDKEAVATVDTNGKVTGVTAGTATITATTADGGYKATCTVTVTSGGSGGGGGGSVGGSSTPITGTYTASVSGTDISETTLPVNIDMDSGNAAINLESISENIFNNEGTAIISVPPVPGINNYSIGIPVAFLSTAGSEDALVFSTNKGSMTLPADMLEGIPETKGKKAEINIGQGDKSGLSEALKATIGNRPLVQVSLKVDGKQTEWNNPEAPVTISIPYTPTAAELANPESIVIWYIDGSGKAVSVPNGHYDRATGTVTFTTTHFSYYAVGYSKVSFKDVAANAWYYKAVGFIAARGITTGTGNGNFAPEGKLTRGELLVMTMRAYGIAPDNSPKDNFADAGNAYYTGYLAAAKRLGISGGVGNNMFAPNKEITRQEMFTLLYNALKVIGQIPEGNSGKQLSDFNDAGQIASWAKDAVKLMVESGIVSGNDGKLSPGGTTTRAQMAQVLYSLLKK